MGIGAGTGKITLEQHRAVDVDLNLAFARGLKESRRVKHFAFMSAVGANARATTAGPGGAGFARYNRVKGEAEEAVKATGLDVRHRRERQTPSSLNPFIHGRWSTPSCIRS